MSACYDGPSSGSLNEVVEACMEAESKLEDEYYLAARKSYFANEYRSARE
jgi:hypothetical protein